MNLSVVLPCYNEEGNIERVVREAFAWFQEERVQGEVVVTNDGSTDGSGGILAALQREFPALTVVQHPTNSGYGAAMRSGCDAATGDVIVTVDSDRQFRVRDAGKLLPLLEQSVFVAGYREKRADPLRRKMNAMLYGFLIRFYLGIHVRDVNCALKAFRRSIWPTIRPTIGTGALYNAEIFLALQEAKIPWAQAPVPHYPREAGTQTGAKLAVILRMFKELAMLKKKHRLHPPTPSSKGGRGEPCNE